LVNERRALTELVADLDFVEQNGEPAKDGICIVLGKRIVYLFVQMRFRIILASHSTSSMGDSDVVTGESFRRIVMSIKSILFENHSATFEN
jgi:hypothetical protein